MFSFCPILACYEICTVIFVILKIFLNVFCLSALLPVYLMLIELFWANCLFVCLFINIFVNLKRFTECCFWKFMLYITIYNSYSVSLSFSLSLSLSLSYRLSWKISNLFLKVFDYQIISRLIKHIFFIEYQGCSVCKAKWCCIYPVL